jgi:hypothetical protein
MENLKDTEKFVIYKKGEDLPRYISKLVSWIERFVFNRIPKRVNWLLDRVFQNHYEIISPNNTGREQDGNWRIRNDGTNIKVERRESGTWVNKGGFTA